MGSTVHPRRLHITASILHCLNYLFFFFLITLLVLPSSFPLIRMFQNPRYQEKTCIPALAKYLTIDFLPSVAAELNAVHRKLLHAPRDAAPDIAPALYMQDLVGLMGEMVDCSVCVVSAVSDTVRCGIHTCKPFGSFCIRFHIHIYLQAFTFHLVPFLIVFVSYTYILASLYFSPDSFFSLCSFHIHVYL